MGRKNARGQANRTAQSQFGWNQRSLDQAQKANRVNQTGPWGSKTWNPDGSLSVTLDPADQQRLDMRRQIQNSILGAVLAGGGQAAQTGHAAGQAAGQAMKPPQGGAPMPPMQGVQAPQPGSPQVGPPVMNAAPRPRMV